MINRTNRKHNPPELRKVLLGCFGMAAIYGCSQAPPRVTAPSWKPERFTEAAMEQLDTDQSGQIDDQEITAAPGLAAGMKPLDKNNDGLLTPEELLERFTLYKDLRVGLTMQSFIVTHKNRPLANAAIRFEPEAFLEGVVEPATGSTDAYGNLTPVTEGAEINAVRVGYYRVIAQPEGGEELTGGLEISPVSDGLSGTQYIRVK